MDNMTELQNRRKLLWKSLRSSDDLLKRSMSLHTALEKRHEYDKSEYEKCDRALSMLDGRYEKCAAAQAAQTDKKKKPKKELTVEQVMQIIKEIGLRIEK